MGKRGRYGIGGALLATRTGTPDPAHRAQRRRVLGTLRVPQARRARVQVVIGTPIATAGRDALERQQRGRGVDRGAQMRELNPERYADA